VTARFVTLAACLCLGLLPELSKAQSDPLHPASTSGTNVQARAQTSSGANLPELEGALHGFPVMTGLSGKKLADAEFNQWLENDLLHVTIGYDFGAGHHIEEKAVFRQRPRLVQEQWSWSESTNGTTFRHFELNFKSGTATALKRESKEIKRWSESISSGPTRPIAGYGFVMVLKNLRERLIKGERIEIHAVGFTPKPRVVAVELSYGGIDQMQMAGRTIKGERYLIHPKIPAIARVFVEVIDTRIWLTTTPPASFLRWEGPLVEAGDPLIRVDLLHGGVSGPAEPIRSK
jgi:hypothetical protein